VDLARHAFVATGRRGEFIPVAWFRGDPSCGWIKLATNAKIYLLKESGRVTATLTATSYPRGGERWIELDNNYSLQNLLCALFREIGLGPDGWSSEKSRHRRKALTFKGHAHLRYESIMQTRFLSAFAFLPLAASALATSSHGDSRYVARGPR